jgi:hypothetical protein
MGLGGNDNTANLPSDGQLLWPGERVLNGYGRFQGVLEVVWEYG